MSRLALATGFALLAFAANSILCRMALRDTHIDPASFTSVRLISGAATLWFLARLGNRSLWGAGTWISSLALLAYAAAFSFAYVAVTAGTGALLLFGAVQLTMVLKGIASGERISSRMALGWMFAIGGLVTLVFPGVAAAPMMQGALMLGAGISWGIYSLRGRGSTDPLCDTAGNFARAVPGALIISALMWNRLALDAEGVALAILSGAIASGLGYAAWYTALPRLRAIAAANLQLSVPLLTSVAGVILFDEPVTLRLAVASVLLLGGISLATRAGKPAGH